MKIALIGSAPASVRLAPTKDASYAGFTAGRSLLERHQFPHLDDKWQIWACSPGTYGVLERVDRFFETHRWEPGQSWFSPEYCDYLRNFKGPVYTGEVVPEIKNSVRYPREMVTAEFGDFFMTSSLSLMMGLAIIEVVEHRALDKSHDPATDAIGFWGVDMAATEEWQYQRPGCQFFMLEAKRRGIQVIIPPESDLARPMPIYGVCEWTHAHIKGTQRLRELEGRLANARAVNANANNEIRFFEGAIENQKYMMNTWVLNQYSDVVVPDHKGQQLMYMSPQAEPKTVQPVNADQYKYINAIDRVPPYPYKDGM